MNEISTKRHSVQLILLCVDPQQFGTRKVARGFSAGHSPPRFSSVTAIPFSIEWTQFGVEMNKLFIMAVAFHTALTTLLQTSQQIHWNAILPKENNFGGSF